MMKEGGGKISKHIKFDGKDEKITKPIKSDVFAYLPSSLLHHQLLYCFVRLLL
jgi:hypothetical protein